MENARKKLLGSETTMLEGKGLSELLRKNGYDDQEIEGILQYGEKTGQLGTMYKQYTDFFNLPNIHDEDSTVF